MPNETVLGGVSPMPIELYAETMFGCNNGRSICFYSETGDSNDYIQFFDTNTEDGINTQRLDLVAGDHEIFVKCIDAGGNLVEDNVGFSVSVEDEAPAIARIYEEDSKLKIITVRDSECSYSFNDCDFAISEGVMMYYANSTDHFTDWNDEETYYIKCRDEFQNEEADCSAIVKPSESFL